MDGWMDGWMDGRTDGRTNGEEVSGCHEFTFTKEQEGEQGSHICVIC